MRQHSLFTCASQKMVFGDRPSLVLEAGHTHCGLKTQVALSSMNLSKHLLKPTKLVVNNTPRGHKSRYNIDLTHTLFFSLPFQWGSQRKKRKLSPLTEQHQSHCKCKSLNTHPTQKNLVSESVSKLMQAILQIFSVWP